MRISTPSLLVVCALFLATTPATLAAAGRVKGLKGAASKPNNERRLKSKKQKIKGPSGRSCNVGTFLLAVTHLVIVCPSLYSLFFSHCSLLSLDAKKNEVKFECKSRNGGGSSKDGSKDKGSKDKSSSSSDEAVPQDRGITLSAEDINDEIKYKVKTTNDGIKVHLEYKQEVETDDSKTKEETDFELVFEQLVEYVKGQDSDSDSEAYDWDKDEILQAFPLSSWGNIPGVMDDSDGVVSYFTATTQPSVIGGGSVEFNFTISRADLGERMTANSMKIDVSDNDVNEDVVIVGR